MRWWTNLGSSLFGRLAGGVSQWSPDWMASALMSGWSRGSTSGVAVTTTTAGGLPSIYRCVSFISDSLASVELRIIEEQPDGGKVQVTDSDVARALADWSYEDREGFLFHAALGGNGLAIIRRNARGGITALDTRVPRRVLAVLDGEDTVWYSIYPELGPGNGDNEIVALENMAHLRFRNIGDHLGRRVWGVPPIVTAMDALGLVLASRQYQSSLWDKGTIPIGVLKTERTLKQATIDRLRGQWEEFYQGGKATGKVAILEDGMDFTPMKPGIMPSDTDLIEYSRFGVEEAARLYAVPPSVLAQTHNASYSTATEEFRAAVLHCLRPWAARFTDCLTRALLTRDQRMSGMRIEASLDHLLVAPGKETSEWLRDLTANGILSINEARNYLGYPDVAGGEVHRVPVNSTDLKNLPLIGLPTKPQQQQPQDGP